MVMPAYSTPPPRNNGNRVDIRGGTASGDPNRLNTETFDRVRQDVDREETQQIQPGAPGSFAADAQSRADILREAYNPLVSLADAAAAESLVQMMMRPSRGRNGTDDSFYVSLRDPNDRPVDEIDNPNATSRQQSSTTEANDEERNTLNQRMVQDQIRNPRPPLTSEPAETREEIERRNALYTLPTDLGRFVDRKA